MNKLRTATNQGTANRAMKIADNATAHADTVAQRLIIPEWTGNFARERTVQAL